MDQHQHTSGDDASIQRPTRIRYLALGFGCTLAMIVYLDRACMASAASSMIEELGLKAPPNSGRSSPRSPWPTRLFEVPNGWLGDVFGPRKVLIRIAIWWSIFVALSGLVGMTLHGGRVLGGVGAWSSSNFSPAWARRGPFPTSPGPCTIGSPTANAASPRAWSGCAAGSWAD